jgi:hypothetical protein
MTELPSFLAPTNPATTQTLSSPPTHPKLTKPASTLAKNLFKSWHSYPAQFPTMELERNCPPCKALPAKPVSPLFSYFCL